MRPAIGVLLLWLSVSGAHAETTSGAPAHEHLISATRLAWYPGWVLRVMFWYAQVPGDAPVDTGVTLYRLMYRTVDGAGVATQASGLVGVPHELPLRGVVGYLHGTSTLRDYVPSAPTLEGRLVGAGFGGARYLLVAPDYVGLGVSKDVHPYLNVDGTVSAVLDMLRAAQEFCQDEHIDWPANLNLMGFSQGAHAVLAVQRRLETRAEPGLVVRAAASVDGPYDLANIAFPFALAGGAPSHPVYLGYIVNAYAATYGHPVDSLLKEPYASRVPGLFDGTHGDEDIVAALPRSPREMFTTDFLTAFDKGEANWFTDALAANEVYRWTPRAPVRLYYGNSDIDVSPRDSVTAAAAMQARGGNVTAISVGEYDHTGALYHAYGHVRAWFDELNPDPPSD